MNRVALHTLSQLHTFRAMAAAIFALVAVIAAIGVSALGAPDVLHAYDLALGIGVVVATILVGILLWSALTELRQHLRRTLESFDDGLASAHRDALTGALTRAYFIVELKNRLRRIDEEPLTYVQIDMDHLKQLNDGSGHAAGDAALKHLSTTIGASLPNAIVGRLGGDEFGVIILGHDDARTVSRMCRDMLDALSEPTFIAGRHVSLSASAGFATAPNHAAQTDDLMSKADLALYKGKKSGRNAVVAFEEDMHRDESQRRFIERELRAAILMQELDLHYQPIFASDGRTLMSYEALVRWNHPVRGVIPPSDFIPIAESGELIDKLGEWVLRRACAEFSALETPSLSVNVSPIQLRRPDYAARFAAILAETHVPPEVIAVEITENVPLAVEGIETTNIDRIKALGVRIAIDDFGSGNASLSYLRRSSFDILKIDRSYVDNIAENRFDALVVASICRIARASNMTIIAEGIETEAQMHAVTAAGVTALQGYYLGRPQPLRAILRERHKSKPADAA